MTSSNLSSPFGVTRRQWGRKKNASRFASLESVTVPQGTALGVRGDRIRSPFPRRQIQRFQGREAIRSVSVVSRPHLAIELGRRFGVRIVSSPTFSVFTLPRRWVA